MIRIVSVVYKKENPKRSWVLGILEVERSPLLGAEAPSLAGPVGLAWFCDAKQRAQLDSLTQGKLLPCSPPKKKPGNPGFYFFWRWRESNSRP